MSLLLRAFYDDDEDDDDDDLREINAINNPPSRIRESIFPCSADDDDANNENLPHLIDLCPPPPQKTGRRAVRCFCIRRPRCAFERTTASGCRVGSFVSVEVGKKKK